MRVGSLTSLPEERPDAPRLRAEGLRVGYVDTAAVGCVGLQRPNALIYALDVLVPQLAAATDDNPATPVTDLSKAA